MKLAVSCWRGAAVGAFVAALALFSGCGAGASSTTQTNLGDLRLKLPGQDPQHTIALDFGNVGAGTSKQVRLTLDNVGTDTIELTAPRFENVPNGSFFALAPRTLAAAEQADLVLTFSPQEAGAYSGNLVLEHSGATQSASVILSGHAQ